MIIFRFQARRHALQVQLKIQRVRIRRTGRDRIAFAAIIVEHAYYVIRQKTRIMLPREPGPASNGEIALLAPESPDDPSGRLVYSVNREKVTPGHQNIRGTVREPDRIEMISIPDITGGGCARCRLVRIDERNVLQRTPEKHHLIRFQIDLLNCKILNITDRRDSIRSY